MFLLLLHNTTVYKYSTITTSHPITYKYNTSAVAHIYKMFYSYIHRYREKISNNNFECSRILMVMMIRRVCVCVWRCEHTSWNYVNINVVTRTHLYNVFLNVFMCAFKRIKLFVVRAVCCIMSISNNFDSSKINQLKSLHKFHCIFSCFFCIERASSSHRCFFFCIVPIKYISFKISPNYIHTTYTSHFNENERG